MANRLQEQIERLVGMPTGPTKTIRVSIPVAEMLEHVAGPLGKSVPEYVSEVLLQGIKRDLPRAQKRLREMEKRKELANIEPLQDPDE